MPVVAGKGPHVHFQMGCMESARSLYSWWWHSCLGWTGHCQEAQCACGGLTAWLPQMVCTHVRHRSLPIT